MKIITARKIYTQVEGGDFDDFEFSHTLVLLQDGDKFYRARTPQRTTVATSVATSRLEIEHRSISVDGYRPLFSDELTIAPILVLDYCWKKLPDLSRHCSKITHSSRESHASRN